MLTVRSPKETNRIALVGGDIILEEEDEEEEEEEEIVTNGKEAENSKANQNKSEERAETIDQRIAIYNPMTNGESKKAALRPRSEFTAADRVFSPSSNRRPTAPRPVYVNASALKAMKMAANNDKQSN